jgi:sporulation protein YlmC with PRC-barrel domain
VALALATGFSRAAMSAFAENEDQPAASVERASRLLGMPIRNESGEEIGHIGEIVLDNDGERVESFAIQPADMPGSVRYVTVAPDDINQSEESDGLVSDHSRSWISEHAKPLDDATWSRRVSQLIGIEVRDSANKPAGKIRDLLVDLGNRRVMTATIATSGFLGFREKLASVAWRAVSVQPSGRYANVGFSEDELRSLAFEETDYWQKLGFAGEEEIEKAPERDNPPEPSTRTY